MMPPGIIPKSYSVEIMFAVSGSKCVCKNNGSQKNLRVSRGAVEARATSVDGVGPLPRSDDVSTATAPHAIAATLKLSPDAV